MSASACLLLADFNCANLAAYLRHDLAAPAVEVVEAPYDQVVPILADGDHPCWGQQQAQHAVVWTRPEGVSPTFAGMLRGGLETWSRRHWFVSVVILSLPVVTTHVDGLVDSGTVVGVWYDAVGHQLLHVTQRDRVHYSDLSCLYHGNSC